MAEPRPTGAAPLALIDYKRETVPEVRMNDIRQKEHDREKDRDEYGSHPEPEYPDL